MLAALPKDREIVVFCSNVDCLASLAAHHNLVEQVDWVTPAAPT